LLHLIAYLDKDPAKMGIPGLKRVVVHPEQIPVVPSLAGLDHRTGGRHLDRSPFIGGDADTQVFSLSETALIITWQWGWVALSCWAAIHSSFRLLSRG